MTLPLDPPGPASVLVVEDDVKTADTVALYLRHAGHRVRVARTGTEGLERALSESYDLVVLDRMLPGLEGTEILRRIREASPVPAILLTALAGELDRLDGFSSGADDYVVKPFSPRELVARVEALLRRTGTAESPDRGHRVGPLYVDPGAHRATLGGRPLDLSPSELRILGCLASAAQRTYSRAELVDRALEGHPSDRVVDSHIKNLRRKLVDAGGEAGWIHTVFGQGYRLAIRPRDTER